MTIGNAMYVFFEQVLADRNWADTGSVEGV